MNLWQKYVRATSISEAISALHNSAGPAYPIAGGTDLLLDLDQGRHPPAHTLVDLNSINALNIIERRGEALFVGAAAPVSRVIEHALVRERAQALVEACELIGGPQVRNVATLGGNVAHALPAADGTIALLAMGAKAEVAGVTGTRSIPLSGLFMGPGKSSLAAGKELLVGFLIPPRGANEGSSFKRIMRPQGVALPILNLAVWIRRDAEVIRGVRIAVGPGGPVPWRASDAEELLTGRSMSEPTVKDALDALLAKVGFRSSPRRASSDYRRHLVSSLFCDTLAVAWDRALLKDGTNG